MMTVRASSPVRIDLAGGWSDVKDFTHKFTGSVVNIAINKRANAELIIDGNGFLKVNYNCEVPVGTGLGTSSAINVALISCISHSDFSAEKSAELAHKFEALLGGPVGRQDQWASSFGGVNYLKFKNDDVDILEFKPSLIAIKWLEEHLILANTNVPHISGKIHYPIWEKFNSGDKLVINSIKMLSNLADEMALSLIKNNQKSVIRILNKVTKITETLSPLINEPARDFCNSLMNDEIIDAWKIMGAGGGGVVGIICKSHTIIETKEKCANNGWTVIDWEVENEGVIIEKVIQ
ncbi:MAG: hypothetical protein CMB56_001045 [Methanobacteriota archaeon]|nr:MAG: hypothetical protein CMB56_001045 [Euryarchaeota archaeon]|tara:strand:- start:4928 stop:5806 length:879 start_codon:yes stop_codon:yes gene_type:complete